MRTLTVKPQRPSPEEVSQNPRSRSARLRAGEKVVLTGLASPEPEQAKRAKRPETTGGER